jgi:hypothetical protein
MYSVSNKLSNHKKDKILIKSILNPPINGSKLIKGYNKDIV